MLLNLAAILFEPAVLVSVDLPKKYAPNSIVPKPPSVEFFVFITEKTQYYFLHKVYITGSLVAFHRQNNKMAAEPSESQLGVSWHDSAWIPALNPGNVLEYFSQRTNPFYDRTCNNEVVKMQRLDPSTLQ